MLANFLNQISDSTTKQRKSPPISTSPPTTDMSTSGKSKMLKSPLPRCTIAAPPKVPLNIGSNLAPDSVSCRMCPKSVARPYMPRHIRSHLTLELKPFGAYLCKNCSRRKPTREQLELCHQKTTKCDCLDVTSDNNSGTEYVIMWMQCFPGENIVDDLGVDDEDSETQAATDRSSKTTKDHHKSLPTLSNGVDIQNADTDKSLSESANTESSACIVVQLHEAMTEQKPNFDATKQMLKEADTRAEKKEPQVSAEQKPVAKAYKNSKEMCEHLQAEMVAKALKGEAVEEKKQKKRLSSKEAAALAELMDQAADGGADARTLSCMFARNAEVQKLQRQLRRIDATPYIHQPDLASTSNGAPTGCPRLFARSKSMEAKKTKTKAEAPSLASRKRVALEATLMENGVEQSQKPNRAVEHVLDEQVSVEMDKLAAVDKTPLTSDDEFIVDVAKNGGSEMILNDVYNAFLTHNNHPVVHKADKCNGVPKETFLSFLADLVLRLDEPPFVQKMTRIKRLMEANEADNSTAMIKAEIAILLRQFAHNNEWHLGPILKSYKNEFDGRKHKGAK